MIPSLVDEVKNYGLACWRQGAATAEADGFLWDDREKERERAERERAARLQARLLKIFTVLEAEDAGAQLVAYGHEQCSKGSLKSQYTVCPKGEFLHRLLGLDDAYRNALSEGLVELEPLAPNERLTRNS